MNNSTTSGMSYSYRLPSDYKATNTTSVSCYKDILNIGARGLNPIGAPTPSSPLPTIFSCKLPHAFNPNYQTYNYKQDPRTMQGNGLYNNGGTGGAYGSQGPNKNTQDTYRNISMPNEALMCGGLGPTICNPKQMFVRGFNDVSR